MTPDEKPLYHTNPDDPRLDTNAAELVKSGRFVAVEDGRGGLFLRPVGPISKQSHLKQPPVNPG